MGKMKKWLGSPSAASFAYGLLRFLCCTYRYQIANLEAVHEKLRKREPVLFCLPHQHIFPCLLLIRPSFDGFDPAVMISRSQDGQLVGNIVDRLGAHSPRGSSKKGGKEAMEEMIEWIKTRGPGIHIVDGPTGPAGVIKPGAVRIAQRTQASIIPTRIIVDRFWQAGSWDKLLIPKPFAEITLSFDTNVIRPPAENAGEEEFERVRLEIEERMKPYLYGF